MTCQIFIKDEKLRDDLYLSLVAEPPTFFRRGLLSNNLLAGQISGSSNQAKEESETEYLIHFTLQL